jgi:hypothetical protein
MEKKVNNNKIQNFRNILLENTLCAKIDKLETSDYELPTDFQRENHDELEIKIYDDLQDIIIVDPIHDTSLKGWPEKEGK